jgi:hypothetical protein
VTIVVQPSTARDRTTVPDGKIVVLGGYGAVGQVVARKLADWYPGRAAAAGPQDLPWRAATEVGR